MKALLKRMLDETEFLSDHGVRALSRVHLDNPFTFYHNGESFSIRAIFRPSRTRACSGAIRIGADRSGCPSTIC